MKNLQLPPHYSDNQNSNLQGWLELLRSDLYQWSTNVTGAITALLGNTTNNSFIPGQIQGTTTNDSAGLGKVGEIIQSNVPIGSSLPITTGVASNVTSISLTAGDWDVWGSVNHLSGDVMNAYTFMSESISLTSGTIPPQAGGSGLGPDATSTLWCAAVTPGTGNASAIRCGPVTLSLASTTTVYLVVLDICTTNARAYGSIVARRAR